MNPKDRKTKIIKTIKSGLLLLILLVFITFLVTGSLKSFYSWAIIICIAILRFVVPSLVFWIKDKNIMK